MTCVAADPNIGSIWGWIHIWVGGHPVSAVRWEEDKLEVWVG